MHCKICDSPADRFGDKVMVLKRYEVQFWRCPSCGFAQSEDPYWLEEAYQTPIASSDLGYVQRNRSFGWVARSVINLFYEPGGRFLDYGGGYGLFTRDMRDRGYDFHLLDKYTPNLFATGFEWERLPPGTMADLVTCFEVMEHFPDPHGGLSDILSHGSEVLFSTSIIEPNDIKSPLDWYYFAIDEGQHVSLHTVESLRRLGARHGLYLHTNGRYLHLFSKSNSPALRRLFPWVSRLRIAEMVQAAFRRPSLLDSDMGFAKN
jgi:hypothetical protein